MGGTQYHHVLIGGKKALLITSSMTNIKTTVTGTFFGCGLSPGTYTTGVYGGETNIAGRDAVTGVAADIWVE